jgi:hypothetical protein
MHSERPIQRRTFLRGLGTLLAIPAMDSLMPLAAVAGQARSRPINRLAFFYVPNGVHMADWTPAAVGPGYELPATLEVLKPFREDLLVLTGLTQDKARPNGDGPGDHARAAACFLTGVQPLKTFGANIRAGVSVDQVAAAQVGQRTRLPSLELGCDRGPQAGDCDSGYSCAYSANISWKSESTPMAKEINPRLVFERLFSNGIPGEAAESRARRERYRKSILDLVLDDARRLKGQVGPTDSRKLDEYLSGVREIERRVELVERDVEAKAGGLSMPGGVPKDYQEHIRLLADLMVLAFQGDLTRVSTFMLANEGSNRSYPFIEVREGHHDLSHHGGDAEKQSKLQKINRFHLSQFAYFLGKLKSIPEGDGTLLDHSMIVYGSCISDGNRHNHDELPVLLAGGGAGTLKTGRHVRYRRNTPLNNLYLSLLDRIDAEADTLGDSTGRLHSLYGETRSF